MDIRGSGAHRQSRQRRPGQNLILAMNSSQRPSWGMQAEVMEMGHNGSHSGALTSAVPLRPAIMPSTPACHCAAVAIGPPVPPLWRSCRPLVAVRARASPQPRAAFGVPGPGDVPLPQSDIRFVIFE